MPRSQRPQEGKLDAKALAVLVGPSDSYLDPNAFGVFGFSDRVNAVRGLSAGFVLCHDVTFRAFAVAGLATSTPVRSAGRIERAVKSAFAPCRNGGDPLGRQPFGFDGVRRAARTGHHREVASFGAPSRKAADKADIPADQPVRSRNAGLEKR